MLTGYVLECQQEDIFNLIEGLNIMILNFWSVSLYVCPYLPGLKLIISLYHFLVATVCFI